MPRAIIAYLVLAALGPAFSSCSTEPHGLQSPAPSTPSSSSPVEIPTDPYQPKPHLLTDVARTPTPTAILLTPTPSCEINEDTRANTEAWLYRFLLLERDAQATQLVLLSNRTSNDIDRLTAPDWPNLHERMDSLTLQLFFDYLISNSAPPPIPETIGFHAPTTYLSTEQHDALFDDSPDLGWSKFYERFPESSGYWVFSRAGLSCDSRRAFIFVGHGSCPMC